MNAGRQGMIEAGDKKAAPRAPAMTSAPQLFTASSAATHGMGGLPQTKLVFPAAPGVQSALPVAGASQARGQTPSERLMKAIWRNDCKQAMVAIEDGADLDAIPAGKLLSPLTAAITKGRSGLVPISDMVRILIENGADPDQMDDTGKTPLTLALSGKDQTLALWLLSENRTSADGRPLPGADPNKAEGNTGLSPLMAAIDGRHYKVLQKLLAKLREEDENLSAGELSNALDQAVENKDAQSVWHLLNAGARSGTQASSTKELFRLSLECREPILAIDLVVSRKIKVNIAIFGPGKDQTALMQAVSNRDRPMVDTLMNFLEADIDKVDSSGDTALMKAVRLKDKWAVQKLLDKGADAGISNKQEETAWTLALPANGRAGDGEIIEMLTAARNRKHDSSKFTS